MFVCLCRVVADRQVEEAVQNGAQSIEEIGEACGAGTGCGACHEMLEDMLKKGNKSQAVEPELFQIAGLAPGV